jgi:hypothetical protein
MNRVDGDVENRRDLRSGVTLEIVKDDDDSPIIVERSDCLSQNISLRGEWVLWARDLELRRIFAPLRSKVSSDSASHAEQPPVYWPLRVDFVPAPIEYEKHLVSCILDVR